MAAIAPSPCRAATINRELSALSAALYHAAKMTGEGGKPLLAHVPIFPAKLPEAPPRKGFIGDAEYALLAAKANQPWLRALLACAYSFGFRKGELLGLRVSQVDLFSGWIELYGEETKNGEPRRIKLTQECVRLLAPCCACKKDSDLVLTRADGGRIVDFRKEWKALVTACGLPWLRLHDFRRSAIRNATRRGVSQTVAMRISGHKTASVFRRYDIVDERDLEQATAKIEAGFAPEKTDTKTDTSSIQNLGEIAIPSVTA
ncbi:MAG TPA: site-specific integrase [Candidatus Acidoferrales bacterium]|nr:site-specific integrase [Candidatus Acidoferrales bacterium]